MQPASAWCRKSPPPQTLASIEMSQGSQAVEALERGRPPLRESNVPSRPWPLSRCPKVPRPSRPLKEADRLSENQYLHLLSHEFSLDLRKGPRSPVQQPPPFPSPQKRSCRCSDNTSNSLLRLHHCSHRGYLHSRTPHLLHLQSHLHLPLDSAPSMSYSSTSSSTALSHPRFHQ